MLLLLHQSECGWNKIQLLGDAEVMFTTGICPDLYTVFLNMIAIKLEWHTVVQMDPWCSPQNEKLYVVLQLHNALWKNCFSQSTAHNCSLTAYSALLALCPFLTVGLRCDPVFALGVVFHNFFVSQSDVSSPVQRKVHSANIPHEALSPLLHSRYSLTGCHGDMSKTLEGHLERMIKL